MNIRIPVSVWALACIMSNFVTPSIADDAERGRQLAERWCTSCHVVVDDVPGGTIGPAFEVVVPLRGRSDAQLKAWLALPHEPMPDFGLSAREINDIVAYIALVGQR